jgi:hypothetical protein
VAELNFFDALSAQIVADERPVLCIIGNFRWQLERFPSIRLASPTLPCDPCLASHPVRPERLLRPVRLVLPVLPVHPAHPALSTRPVHPGRAVRLCLIVDTLEPNVVQ